MNKKGMSQGAVILISVFLLIAAIGAGGWFFLNKTDEQTNKIIQSTQQQTQTQTETSNKGQVATLKILSYDRSQNDQSNQTTVPTYCMKGENGEMKLIADALALSKTARVNQPVRIGDVVKCISFNNTYYGAWEEITIKDETEFMDLDNWAIANAANIEITIFNKDRTGSSAITTAGTFKSTFNLTGTASTTTSLAAIKFKVNSTDVVYNLGGVLVDIADNSSIDDLDFNSGLFSGTIFDEETGASKLERIKSVEFPFEFDSNPGTPEKEAIWLEENDEVEFGKFEATIDATGCTSTHFARGCEFLNMTWYDKAYYRSAKVQEIKGPAGENDADTPTNVGASGALGTAEPVILIAVGDY